MRKANLFITLSEQWVTSQQLRIEEKKGNAHKEEEEICGRGEQGRRSIASIFTVARASLDEDIVCPRSHGAKIFVSSSFSG